MLDVHKSSVTACVRIPQENEDLHQQIREFATTTRGLMLLRDWLASFGVRLVGMEATGVYWKPIYYMLEDDFELWLLNARHLKNVPGRKTDVKDAEWICQLVEHGLVRPSFVPPKEIRELSTTSTWRPGRKGLRRAIPRRQKPVSEPDFFARRTVVISGVILYNLALSRADYQSNEVVLGTSLVTARLKNRRAHQGSPASGEGPAGCGDKALFCGHSRAWCLRKSDARRAGWGTTDPEVLAELARGRLRSKLPALRDALEGSFSSHHALMVGKIVAHVDYLDESIGDLSAEIERVIAPFSDKVELLDTIPGVNRRTAETLIAEIGVDMDQFPTHKHLGSWAGMCPGNEESAGKRRSGKTRKGSKWLRSALTESARAAARSKETYLASHYARLRGRRGSKKAAVAVGHSILVICYHVLERQVPYEDLGEDYFDRRRSSEAYAKRLVRKLERLGHKVALETLPQSA